MQWNVNPNFKSQLAKPTFNTSGINNFYSNISKSLLEQFNLTYKEKLHQIHASSGLMILNAEFKRRFGIPIHMDGVKQTLLSYPCMSIFGPSADLIL